MKTCRKCKEPKDESEFYLSGKGNPDTVCKQCRCEMRNARRNGEYKDPFKFTFGGGI